MKIAAKEKFSRQNYLRIFVFCNVIFLSPDTTINYMLCPIELFICLNVIYFIAHFKLYL